jgi:hypothetical protein
MHILVDGASEHVLRQMLGRRGLERRQQKRNDNSVRATLLT